MLAQADSSRMEGLWKGPCKQQVLSHLKFDVDRLLTGVSSVSQSMSSQLFRPQELPSLGFRV